MSAREQAEECLNTSINAWGERTSDDPDVGGEGKGWVFGWYAIETLNAAGLVVVRAEDAKQLAQLNRVEPTIESLEAGIAADLRARANVIAALADQSGDTDRE